MALYILNESRARNVAGDVTVFRDLSSLLQYVEPIDVMNGEYFAYSTDGNRVELIAIDEFSPVTGNLVPDNLVLDNIYSILRDYLLTLSNSRNYSGALQRKDIEVAKSVDSLLGILPQEVIVATNS